MNYFNDQKQGKIFRELNLNLTVIFRKTELLFDKPIIIILIIITSAIMRMGKCAK